MIEEKYEPELTFKKLFPNESGEFFSGKTQFEILCLIPPLFRVVDEVDFLLEAEEKCKNPADTAGRKVKSLVTNGKDDKRCRAMANNMIRSYYACRNSADWFEIKEPFSLILKGVETLVSSLDNKSQDNYSIHINTLLHNAEASTTIACKYLTKNRIPDLLMKLSLVERVARLVVIACTWTMWFRPNDNDVKLLTDIVMPEGYAEQEAHTHDVDTIKKETNEFACGVLKKAEAAFLSAEYDKCTFCCSQILMLVNADDCTKGKAYYLIVKCVDEHDCEYDEYYDSAEFKRQALDLGCVEAQKEWDRSSIWSLKYKPARALSSADMPQRVICNSKNLASDAFVSSLPEAFSDAEKLVYAKDPAAITAAASGVKKSAILLVDDDLDENFAQFITVLDQIHAVDPTSTEHDTEFEFLLRTDENKYYSLIDLALKHARSRCIRVHLIDENKTAAQQLLSRHPLFYHIQSISAAELNESQKTINYVVVGDNAETLIEWLVREAFWMGCFNYRGVTLNITVMSPLASKIESNMKGKFRGMFEDLGDLDDVSKVKLEFIQIVDISSCEVGKKIDELHNCSSLFFVVAAQDCVDGLNTAKRLREWSIRKEVQKGNSITSTASLPIIAFYCSNDTLAHLSRSISVQSIDSGGSWYNNYRLIPFGMKSELYNYNNLHSNIMDEISSCVDLQYSRVAPDAKADIVINGLRTFYSRVYSRDSSLAVALSIPYRLFHMPDNDSGEAKSDHIVPRGWSIMNGNAYTDSQSIRLMAEKFKRGLKDESTIEQLLVYEHARWCRYMLSRGWVKANPSETISYMNSGNPKQQLFIASMHGCICPVEDLSLLQQEIYRRIKDEERKEKYAPDVEKSDAWDFFTAMDRSSIISTPDLMLRTWLQRIRVNTNELQQRMEEK